MENFFIILAGAVIVEALVQCVRATPITFKNGAWWEVIASLVGILVASMMQLNLIGLITPISGIAQYGGVVATGIIIGRGSSFVHDLFGKLKTPTIDSIELIEYETKEKTK